MSKSKPLPIRFPNETITKLEQLAKENGLNVSSLVRLMVQKYIVKKYTI